MNFLKTLPDWKLKQRLRFRYHYLTTTGNSSHKQSPSPSTNFTITESPFQKTLQSLSSQFQEKEWECWCGHKFRAPGIWIPCAPTMCQAPRCPNPRYFIDGGGKQKLEERARLGCSPSPLPSRSVGSDEVQNRISSQDLPNVICLSDGLEKQSKTPPP